jgi:AcrR family transcriptional regulator
MPRKPGLNRKAVVDAAQALLDSGGREALTLNRLAQALGIQPPSLYNHIDGLPGLYRELSLRNAQRLGERLSQAAIGKSGAQAVLALAETYRAYIKESPGLYLASLQASGNQPEVDEELRAAEQRVVAVCLAVLAAFGLEGEDGLHAVRGLRSLVHGFATLEIAGGFGLPLDCDESFRRLVAMFLRGLERSGDNITER